VLIPPQVILDSSVRRSKITREDLKGKAIRGGFVKACAQAVGFLLRIGSLMVLARLLEPEDFGLVAMVTVVTGVFGLFKDAGLSMATVQSATITDKQISALFWINLLVGVILGFLSVALAPALVAFYQEPRLFGVALALACGFVLNAGGVQHAAILERRMRFATLAFIEIISLLLSVAVGIIMAVNGCGYWTLVGMALVTPAAFSIGVWLAADWIPGMPQRKAGIRPMMRFGGTVTLGNLIIYVAFNTEKVLLGRYWGAEALGLYGRAYQLVNIPTENLNSAIGGVALSALSRLQNDPHRLKNYFLKGYSLVLALTLPITMACALFAEDIIFVFLGPKWMSAAIIFRLLTPVILVFALINPLGWLLISTGKIGRSLKISLVLAPLVIVACVAGLPYGPTGVALGFSAMMSLMVMPVIAWAIHGTLVSSRNILQAVGRSFISGVFAAALAFGVQFFFGQMLSPLLRLVMGCSVLLFTYLWMLLYVMRQKAFYFSLLKELRWQSLVGEKEHEIS
jgi:PST family polysaccharide transporter